MTWANEALPITGYAQVGVSGLSKVQVWLNPNGKPWPADDPYFTNTTAGGSTDERNTAA